MAAIKKSCTFFGHRIVSKEIESTLRSTLINLIENHNVKLFYVGNQGYFDYLVSKVLHDLSLSFNINYYIVLAYLPVKCETAYPADYSNTILPDVIETVPKRFAISYRNKWMIEHSDYVVTYVTHDIGSGAAKFKKIAENKGKKIIEIS